MTKALQPNLLLTAEEIQQLEDHLILFPPNDNDVEAFRSGVLVFAKAQRDKALFDWVMRLKPPEWYAQYAKAPAMARALSRGQPAGA